MFDLLWSNLSEWRQLVENDAIPAPPSDRPVERVVPCLWEEHCVECAVPDCFHSCQLFVQREDKRCARFSYGIYPNHHVHGLFRYGADIHFRRWAKLEANLTSKPRLLPVRRVRLYASALNSLSLMYRRMARVSQTIRTAARFDVRYRHYRSRLLGKLFGNARSNSQAPDALYVKFFYPGQERHQLIIETVQDEVLSRTSVSISPGWNEHTIPFSDLNLGLTNRLPIIRVLPDNDAELRLIFTWLDLVTFDRRAEQNGQLQSRKSADKVKCVAWDLDNTLWDGVIGDVGPENVKPNPHVIELIRSLDQRGILQTIASKNNHAIAWKKIEELGLADYFLYPAIHWGPKSDSLTSIAKELNVNLDTFAFIDDSAFERAEVNSSYPQVRVYDPAHIDGLLQSSEFDVPVSPESRSRRLKYLEESSRRQVKMSWKGDYESFLASCDMRMTIGRPKGHRADRCLELLQRSNQFNLSGRRYSKHEFENLLADASRECLSFEVADKFGEYGTVGFAAFEIISGQFTLVDFVQSCRVAQKKVDETFLLWYASRIQTKGADRLRARFKVTDRNAPLREVFTKLSFDGIKENGIKEDGTEQLLELKLFSPIEVPSVIRVSTDFVDR